MPTRDLTTADGTRLRYRIDGRGKPPLVFIHGWCSNLTHFDAQFAHFAPRHRVLAVDRRGQGGSQTSRGGYNAKQHAADLAAIVRHEKLSGAVVVGHAGGGPTTLTFARAHPNLARAVVLIDTHISPKTPLGPPGKRSPLGTLVDHISGSDGESNFAAMYRSFFSAHAGEATERAVSDALRVEPRVRAAELASLAVDDEGLARKLSQAVLWITVGNADEARFKSIFRDVQFGRVVGSGHFPHVEVPDQVNAMIDRFVSTLPN